MTTPSVAALKKAQLGILFVLSLLLLALVIAVSVGVGELSIPLRTTFYAVSNKLGLTHEPLNRIHETVLWDFRLSRALVAACCGAGLAICGTVLQSLLKNALAEPYVLGVSAGASTGAVSVVVLGIGAGALSLSAGAFLGAFAAFLFVAVLTNGARGGNERTILAGVAASQLFNAITAWSVSTSASAQQARDVMFWLLGSFSGVRWPEFQLVLVVVILGLLACLYHAKALDAFTFGDDAAASLGIPVGVVRLILFSVTALITATIVSMAGSIGFVGLVVPHVMRYFIGPLHRRLLVASALAGAILMVLADIASRTLIAPQTLPVGVVTALVGVPFFAIILYRSRRFA
ncbi:Iron ABC transporter permease [Kosakonia sp. BK9b]